MPRIFSLLLPMWSVSCAAPSDSDTHLPSDSDGETASFPETGTVPEPSASLQGRVVDGDGEALEGLQLRVCMDSCVTTATDASGAFSFSTLDVGTHTMQAVSFSSEQDSTPHAIVTLAAEEDRVLEDWVLPRFETWEVLEDSATLSLDAGLVLYAEPDGLSIGPYSPSSEPIVASVRFDPISSGLPLDELEDSPAAAWYLGNYDLQISPPWTLTSSESLGLDSGIYTMWTADNETKSWRPEGRVEIEADGSLVLIEGGLSQLTTLVLLPTTEDPP